MRRFEARKLQKKKRQECKSLWDVTEKGEEGRVVWVSGKVAMNGNEIWRELTLNPLPVQNGPNEVWQFQLMQLLRRDEPRQRRLDVTAGLGSAGAGGRKKELWRRGNRKQRVESEHFSQKDHSHLSARLRRSISAWQKTTVFNDLSA